MKLDTQAATPLGGRLRASIDPVVAELDDPIVREALPRALDASTEALAAIERCFAALPEAGHDPDARALFFNAWKATHLKMLAIYGLTCRLHRLAVDREGGVRDALFVAAHDTAATSHEDLGLDYDGHTHEAMYRDCVAAFLPDDGWMLARHALPEAEAFKRWVYRGMVVAPIEVGLACNLFSEIYNHAEYSLAEGAVSRLLDRLEVDDAAQRGHALAYIRAHIEDDTELDHFRIMLHAIDRYGYATGQRLSVERAAEVFTEYLTRLGAVFAALTARWAKS